MLALKYTITDSKKSKEQIAPFCSKSMFECKLQNYIPYVQNLRSCDTIINKMQVYASYRGINLQYIHKLYNTGLTTSHKRNY